ncbi:RNA polymerase sigma factor [Solicola sp. PLA-1-18]|uniref:RNA polymerase sigma factor n=1 Tax=Solicola sp. PLA-1-18 TaxID=3380532 RepID=UPI003B7CF8E5
MPAQPDQKPTDRALVRRAVMGNREAFTQIFERYSESTYRYALHMLDGDEQDAHDVTQESWVKVWQHLHTWRGEAQLRTWLFTVVGRTALDHRRHRRPLPMEDARIDAHSPPGASTEAEFAGLALWDVLNRVLSELPWRQRAAWLLRELEDLGYEDIARVLDTTPTVVRGQLHRARKTVATRMEEWR